MIPQQSTTSLMKKDLRFFFTLSAFVVILLIPIFKRGHHTLRILMKKTLYQNNEKNDLDAASNEENKKDRAKIETKTSKPVSTTNDTMSPAFFLRNLPVNFNFNEEEDNGSKCAKYPHFTKIKVNNEHYQVLETDVDIFYLYGAYLDNRKNNKKGSCVRIVGMNKKRKNQDSNHCRIWFNKTESIITNVSEFLPLGWLPSRVKIK